MNDTREERIEARACELRESTVGVRANRIT